MHANVYVFWSLQLRSEQEKVQTIYKTSVYFEDYYHVHLIDHL